MAYVDAALVRLGISSEEVAKLTPMGRQGSASLITLEDGRSYFVKRARPAEHWGGRNLVAVEALVTPLMHGLAPAVILEDEAAGLLVLDGVVGEQVSTTGTDLDLSIECATRLGALLAEVHLRVEEATNIGLPLLSSPVPRPDLVTPSAFAEGPGWDYPEFLSFLQSDDLPAAFRSLAESWDPSGLIHGDVRGDNVLRLTEGSLVFVDWELAGLGDRRWDLGSLLGMYLFAWLGSIRAQEEGEIEDWLKAASVPLESVAPGARACAASYSDAMPTPAGGWDGYVCASLRYAGVFLVQRAAASLESGGLLTQSAWCCLYAARRLLIEPERGGQLLWGEDSPWPAR